MGEVAVARAMVELADTLVGDYDPDDFLDRLCRRCLELFDVDYGAIILGFDTGNLTTAVASHDTIEAVEHIQIRTGEGPGVQAWDTGHRVLVNDLAAPGAPWPEFRQAAANAGVTAVLALPMRLRQQRVGALDLFRTRQGPFPESDVHLAQALADIASIGLVHAQTFNDATTLTRQLQVALDSRVVIEQAKGVLAERHGYTPDKAFEALRRHSRSRGLMIRRAAEDVLAGRLDPAPPPA